MKDFFLQFHTGESIVPATKDWPWDKRRTLGQRYLVDFASVINKWHLSQIGSMMGHYYKERSDKVVRAMELDGYIFRDGSFQSSEVEVLDHEQERGLLHTLYQRLGLGSEETQFAFLDLAEEHYRAGRWSDCIANSRKFMEGTLSQIARKHGAVSNKGLSEAGYNRPVEVRTYLEAETLLEKKEREAIDKIYGLLSHTGAHPYMAEQDQARLLRQMALITTQFVLLRLEGWLP